MPQQISIPDQGVVEFPDEYTPDQIKGVIKQKFYSQPTTASADIPSLPTQVVTPEPEQTFVGKSLTAILGVVKSQIPTSQPGPEEIATSAVPGPLQMAIQGTRLGMANVEAAKLPLGSQEQYNVAAQDVFAVGQMALPLLPKLFKGVVETKPTTLTDTLFPKPPEPPEVIPPAAVEQTLSKIETQAPVAETQALGQVKEETPVTPSPEADIVQKVGEQPNAIQESQAGTVLQREQGQVGEAGGQRVGVEPSIQGQETAAPIQETERGQPGQEAVVPAKTSTIRGQEISTGDDVQWMSGGTWDGKVQDIAENPSGTHDVTVKATNGEIHTLKNAEQYGINSGQSKFITSANKPSYPGWEKDYPELAPAGAGEAGTGLPPAKPGEPAAPTGEPLSVTSTKNAVVDQEREARGLPAVTEPLRKEFGESWDNATKKIDQNPSYPDQLITELKIRPRALTDEENATLLHRQVDLQNQFQNSADALSKSKDSGDEVSVMEQSARTNALSDQLLELYDVGKKAGTETGRGLASRQMLAAEDFSLANMVTQKRAANQGAPLTDAQTEQVKAASEKVTAAQAALSDYEGSPKLQALKKRYATLTGKYQERTAAGDFAPPQRQSIVLDKEGEQLKANLERAKKDWLTGLQKDRATNRTPSQKFWDRFVGVERAMKLSSDVVLAKLSAAAAVREAGLTPAEEVVGAGIGKILPGLAKRAPREGGFSLAAEIKAKSEMFTSGMKDAWKNLQMKQTDLDTLYSTKKPPPPSEFYDYLGYLHGALKAPIKRAEFARSLTKRMTWAVENGQDLNNVNTMRSISDQAYVDANRSIFMQDNVVASTFTGALRMAEQSKKAPNLGPAIARIGRFLVPIVKIPTNIVGEVATGIHGVPIGGARAAVAYLKGIDTLPPVEADSIMRQLKKGSIGGALILAGYYGASNIGGFYHDKDKRAASDVQAGRYRIGSVDLPASAGHSTGAMLLNIGATVKRVQNEQIKKSGPATKGLGEGARAAGAGLAHEIPFVPAATGIIDALGSKNGFEKYINGMIQSTTVPALSSHIAKILDTPGSIPSNLLGEAVKRKPTTPIEAVKMGIPGLRQTVPERQATNVGGNRRGLRETRR